MINIFDFDNEAVEIFNKIYIQNYQDLNSAIYSNLYSLNDVDAEYDYKELYLVKNQQIVIEKYINSIKVQIDKAVMIAYIKAIEHTLNHLNKYNNTPQD